MGFTNFIAQRPYASAVIGVLLISALVYMLSGPGGNDGSTALVASGPSDAEVAAGLQLSQIQAQTGARLQELGVQREIATLEFGAREYESSLASSIALANINAQTNIAALQIGAQERSEGLQAAVAQQQIQAQSSQVMASYSSQVELAKIQAEAIENAYKAQGNTQVALAKEQRKSRGLLSRIFG